MAGPALRRRAALVAAALAAVLLTGCASGGDDVGAAAGPARFGSPPPVPAGVRTLPANATFDYQLGGAYEPDADVRVVDRDRTASPVPGRYDVCYVNAFQSQPGEKAFWFDQHPNLLLRDHGEPFTDPGWPDEYLFDLTTAAKRSAVAAIVGGWIDGCARSGFEAVEPDNLDAYTRSRGAYGADEALAYAALLTRRAHADGLAIAQKNGGDLGTRGRATGFDFAIAEECQAYDECDDYTAVYGDEVVEIEYTDDGGEAGFARACAARGDRIAVLLRDRQVVPQGDPAYVSRSC